jgi:PAS domain S-box-containing protein
MEIAQLFEIVPDALIVVDDSGRIVRANRQAEQLFGYAPSALTGLELEALIPEGARDRHRGHRAGYMSSPRTRPMGGSSNLSLIGQRLDGQQFPVEIALSPVNIDVGLCYLASVRDISETHRARQVVVRARHDALVARIGQLALEAADERLMIDELPALLAEALNVEAVGVLFLHPERGDVELLASVGLGDRGASLDMPDGALKRALSDGVPLIIEDLSVQAPDELSWLIPTDFSGSLAMMPLQGRDRALGALFARSSEPRRFDHDALHLLRSVANLLAALVLRRRTEEQLAHSQRLDAVGQLTGGVAHDFNNLLTILSGNLQLLEIECEDRPEANELIASAQRSVARGAELTAKLLAFARRQRLSPRAVRAQTLLHELERMLRGTLGDAIRLQVECGEDVPPAHVDATQLDTALLNLALNARDAMPRGGEISIQASERWIAVDEAGPELLAGHYVVFTVTDTGRGMSPETVTRAAEPFFTTKAVGHGTGLGLSMVHGFVHQSGGHLRIDSRLGYGTRVELYLPVAPSTAVETTAHSDPAFARSTAGQGETLLVVEDNTEVRNVAAAFLRAQGYRVLSVAGAEQALRHLQDDPAIALLFSDVMLGRGLNGEELARAARKIKPGLAVLLTTGYENVANEFPAGESFELLRKPYRHEQLAAMIRRQLDRPGA